MTATTGQASMDSAVAWSLALVTVAGLAALAWRTVRAAVRAGRRASRALDDILGAPARPGTEARPGMLDRMTRLEARVERVEAELRPNGGSSARDALDRVDRRTAQLAPRPRRRWRR
jgi:hypothetical protein